MSDRYQNEIGEDFYLADNTAYYHGSSVEHWHTKAKANGNGLLCAWAALQAAGVSPNGEKTVAEGIAELEAQLSRSDEVRQEALSAHADIETENEALEAQLSALREPTEAMIEAGYGMLPDCKCTEGQPWRAKLIFKAMLTAATEEKK